jgi:hypothetical protein
VASDFAASVHRIDSANIDEEGTPMGTLAEAVVASFGSHPDIEWVQLATSEAKASFVVEGDTVLVDFQQVDEITWRAGFEVQDTSKSPRTQTYSERTGKLRFDTFLPETNGLRMAPHKKAMRLSVVDIETDPLPPRLHP